MNIFESIITNGRRLKESDLSYDLSEYQKWVDYDMKRYHRISKITQDKLDKAGLEVVKDDHGDYEVIAKYDESLKESLEEAELDRYVIRSGISDANPYTQEYSKKTGKHFGYLGHGGRSWVPADSKGIMTFDSFEEADAFAKEHVKGKYNAEIVKIADTFTEEVK